MNANPIMRKRTGRNGGWNWPQKNAKNAKGRPEGISQKIAKETKRGPDLPQRTQRVQREAGMMASKRHENASPVRPGGIPGSVFVDLTLSLLCNSRPSTRLAGDGFGFGFPGLKSSLRV